MHELKLMAVGSDELIADEIKAIMESFIEGAIPIETILTAEVKGVDPEAFYVCATTQEALLAQRIPKEQLFVFDLHPTEEFFAAIARIPSKEDIYVFNNHAAYIRLLVRECRDRGLGGMQFHAISFQEQQRKEVLRLLRRARYIIGVDRMMGSQTLFSAKYRFCLRDDVKIIAGRRAASVASAGRLLTGIAEYYEKEMYREYKALKVQLEQGERVYLPGRIEQLSERVFEVAAMLANAHLHIMASEGRDTDEDELFLDAPEAELTGDCVKDVRCIGAQLRNFGLLRQKLQLLMEAA